jgi:hypothetical protein
VDEVSFAHHTIDKCADRRTYGEARFCNELLFGERFRVGSRDVAAALPWLPHGEKVARSTIRFGFIDEQLRQ